MSLQIGIVGLPNAGKSTLFNALTLAGAATAPYPFTTIEPNVGIAVVPDERLEQLAALVRPERVTPATVEFVDIAGLVRGASQGAGLGNQFLGHIRNVDAVVLVLRAFEDPDIPTTGEQVDPLGDLETLDFELILADLAATDRRIEKVQGQAKAHPRDFADQLGWLDRLRAHLNSGKPAHSYPEPAHHPDWATDFSLLTAKPRLYVINVSEDQLPD
jgi:GTP-binding protein YchF